MKAFKENSRQRKTKKSLKGLSVNYWPTISQLNHFLIDMIERLLWEYSINLTVFEKLSFTAVQSIHSFTRHLYLLSINCQLITNSFVKKTWEQRKSVLIQ